MTSHINPYAGNDADPGEAAPLSGSEVIEPATVNRRLRRAIFGATAGNLLEQYDFGLYGSMAAIALGALFFSNLGPTAALFAGFSTYAVGFFARPFGGMLAGHFGDVFGRKLVLLVTLLVAGFATMAIGLLPTYASAGIWAPIALVTLRTLQGFAVGGEMAGAVLMVNESAPTAKRGFYTSLVTASSSAGVLLANAVLLASATMPRETFLSWGWRIPFLLAIILIAVGAWIRRHMHESVIFEKAMRSEYARERQKNPLIIMLRHSPRQLVQVIGICLGFSAANYILGTWMIGYLSLKGHPSTVGLTGFIIAVTVFAISAVTSGHLSDKFGRKIMITIGSLGFAALAFPIFTLVDTGHTTVIWGAYAAFGFFSGMISGPSNSLMVESFRTDHRYMGSSSAYQIGTAIGGGLSPLLATWLYALWHGTWAISLVVLLCSLVCVVSVRSLKETAGVEIL
ncbi:putative MFS family arabinose efflux permease [Trinickia symbiotica]|uniref:MFS transporter n=1 Tax=Trinickia symbiotica TaxID=863227 RepID=A0A2N7WL23_9BURK|nr:MFS transporter [Trinickia symbiotica]PMS30113.1 MFS transporter [Trinickia symbiotica]PPK41109.1 putative MFS family arabinose efflux permease [Trinickia symbiotica]